MKAGSPQREELSDRKVLTERSSGVVVAHEEDMLASLKFHRKVIVPKPVSGVAVAHEEDMLGSLKFQEIRCCRSCSFWLRIETERKSLASPSRWLTIVIRSGGGTPPTAATCPTATGVVPMLAMYVKGIREAKRAGGKCRPHGFEPAAAWRWVASEWVASL